MLLLGLFPNNCNYSNVNSAYYLLSYIFFNMFLISISDNWLKVLMSSEGWRRLQLSMNGLFSNAKLLNVEDLNLKAQRYTHTLHVTCDFFVCLFLSLQKKI